MSPLELKIIESLVALMVLLLVRYAAARLIVRRYRNANFDITRKELTIKLINVLFFVILGFGLAGIWGLTGAQIFAYITSVLTILGVAFFAQWSLLSNITSGLILFFNHPMKLGDYIEIVDKDFPMEGRVENITLFFLHLRNKDNQVYTLSNSMVVQKTMRIMAPDEIEELLKEQEEEEENTANID
ncbi:mechanosensitive ion channel domain-containing protein [Croceiramulus getboli]|nr:mechanosensitive ion channel [Flavobacteriaceae bacterium YJPT1-3]